MINPRVSLLCSIALLLSICLVALMQFDKHHEVGYPRISLLRGRRKLVTAFKDIVPDKTLITDMVQLCYNIYRIDGEDVDADIATKTNARTGTKWSFNLWIEAEVSTEAMIVSSSADDDTTSSPTKVVVAFRGSEQEFDDWFTNSKIKRVDSKFVGASSKVDVHQGFQSAVTDINNLNVRGQPCNPSCDDYSYKEPSNGVAQRIEQELLDLVGEDGEVYITGHSVRSMIII